MTGSFDPYQSWLDLNLGGREPNHYELLSLELFEADKVRIHDAADRAENLVSTRATAAQIPLSQKLLYQISTARVCLLNAAEKSRYDEQLRQQQSQLRAEMPVAHAPPPVAQASQPGEMQVPTAPPPPAVGTPAQPTHMSTPAPVVAPTPGGVPGSVAPMHPVGHPQPVSISPAPAVGATTPTVNIIGTTASVSTPQAQPVVAKLKEEPASGVGGISAPSRRIRPRRKMSNETLAVVSVLCLLAGALGIYAIYAISQDDDVPRSATPHDDSSDDHRRRDRRPNRSKPKTTKAQPPSRDEWIDAAASPIQIGPAKVSIIRAFAGPLPGIPGATEYLFVQVRVRNIDAENPLAVERWESWAGPTFRHKAVASDSVGNLYRRENPFDKTLTTGKINLAPNERMDQFLVFERAHDTSSKVRLLLDGKAAGVPRGFRFEIDHSMIELADKPNLAWFYSTLPEGVQPTGAATPSASEPGIPGASAIDPVEAAVGVKPKDPE